MNCGLRVYLKPTGSAFIKKNLSALAQLLALKEFSRRTLMFFFSFHNLVEPETNIKASRVQLGQAVRPALPGVSEVAGKAGAGASC